MAAIMLLIQVPGLFEQLLRSWRLASVFVLALLLSVRPSPGAQVELAWDQNSEPDLAGYRIYYGTEANQLTESIDTGMATTAAVDGLRAGTQYYFAVSAYNSA